MAAPRTPPQVTKPLEYLGEKGEFGTALFTKLVPYSVHIAVSIYEERRDRVVNQNIIGELESLNERIHETLSSLNLPGSFQAFEKPMGLPGTLVQHAEEIRQADAIHKLQRCFADIDKLRTADIAVFEEGRELLQAEEEEDQRLRRKFGTDRWSRPESRVEPNQGAKLWTQVTEAEGWFSNSASSDGVVREKFYSVEPQLAILAGPDRGIMDHVPSSRRMEIPETLKPAINRLRAAYTEVTRLESRRRRKAETLREKARGDDIKSDILAEAARLERTSAAGSTLVPAHFEDFFDRRIDKLYDPELELVKREAQEQERSLQELHRASREFDAQKRRSASAAGGSEREQALQRLENAYYKYKELVSNVEVGRKFYNDLSRIVGGFRDSARAFAAERRAEARGLEDELSMPPLQGLNLGQQSPPMPPQPQPQPPAAIRHQHHQQQPSIHSPPAMAPAVLAQPQPVQAPPWASPPKMAAQPQPQPQPQQPQPQRANPIPMQAMWNPDMGIQFSSPATAPAQQQQPQPQQQGQAQSQSQQQVPGPAPSHTGGTWNPSAGIRFG